MRAPDFLLSAFFSIHGAAGSPAHAPGLRPFCTPARGLSNPGKKQSLTQSVRPRKVGSAPGGLAACYRLTAHKIYRFCQVFLSFL